MKSKPGSPSSAAKSPSESFVMPEGVTTEALHTRAGWLRRTVQATAATVMCALHIELYGNKRGHDTPRPSGRCHAKLSVELAALHARAGERAVTLRK